jgi:hypothetical protein
MQNIHLAAAESGPPRSVRVHIGLRPITNKKQTIEEDLKEIKA